jgi:hypothetical protein
MVSPHNQAMPVVMTIVEAKREDLIGGIGQYIAEMVAAHICNQQHQQGVPRIYGAVTSDTNCAFCIWMRTTLIWIGWKTTLTGLNYS